jgi:hypothetical protein
MKGRKDMTDQDHIRLRNCGGVPVIELIGELNEAALGRIESAMRSLAAAGHYHLVVNVRKAVGANLKALNSLRNTIAQIRSHHGMVDLVAEAGQARELRSMESLSGLLRVNPSEAHAIRKIKRLLRLPDDSVAGTSARLSE